MHPIFQTRRFFLFAAAATLLFAQEETPDKRLQHAAISFHEIMAAPDHAIPRDLLERAQCIVIVPGIAAIALMKMNVGYTLPLKPDGTFNYDQTMIGICLLLICHKTAQYTYIYFEYISNLKPNTEPNLTPSLQ